MKRYSFHSKILNSDFEFKCEFKSIHEVYRNYRTVLPPIDTFSDLLEDEEELKTVRKYTDAFSGIDLGEEVTNRPFQYANAFPEIKSDDFFRGFIQHKNQYPYGRFGDGLSYGVLYCAVDKDTSESEAIFYAVKEFSERLKDMKEDKFSIDRKMVTFDFEGELIDLFPHTQITPHLISEDYSFCQEIGRELYKKIHAFKSPSARKKNGICLPIFNKSSIKNFHQKDSFKYNFRISIFKNDPDNIVVENITSRVISKADLILT